MKQQGKKQKKKKKKKKKLGKLADGKQNTGYGSTTHVYTEHAAHPLSCGDTGKMADGICGHEQRPPRCHHQIDLCYKQSNNT